MCWGHSTTFTTMHHLLLSWVRSIQSRCPQAISWSFILILPYLSLCLQSGLSPSCFPHQHPVHWSQSLSIYWSEECFNKTVVEKTNTFYIHYTFHKSYRFQKEQRYWINVCHSLSVPTCHLAFSKVISVTCQPQYIKAKWKQDADLCRSPTMCPLRVAEHRQQDRK
jgi:hypothetical protein